jgi:NADH-quinone oxidoreductase subunit D
MGLLDRILRVGDGKKLKALSGIIPDVNALEPEIHKLSDDALRAKTAEFRQRIERGEMLDDLLIDAFAVTRETALRTCLTGPVIRATGIPYDVRRTHPYSVYPELEFEIPTRTEGDSYARYMLHIDEIRQSIHIIDQVLHQMPDGAVMAKLPRRITPRPGRAFIAIESPRGQYAAYVMSDGSNRPYRMRIHDPSFFNLQVVNELVPGNLVADTMAIMASLDPIMGGIDK